MPPAISPWRLFYRRLMLAVPVDHRSSGRFRGDGRERHRRASKTPFLAGRTAGFRDAGGHSDPCHRVDTALDPPSRADHTGSMRWITTAGSRIELLNPAIEQEYTDYLLRVTAADGTEIGSFDSVTDLQNNVDLAGLRSIDDLEAVRLGK